MASDNTLLNAGTGGETIRSLGDASGLNWPVGVSAYPTTISAGANVLQLVDLTHGLPIQPQTGSTFAVTGTFWQATQPVSAVSLPLPSGAATDAKQDTGNTSLASIDTKTPALGQALAAASVPVVLTAAQIATLTPLATVAVTQSTSPWVCSLASTTITGTVAVTQSTSPWVVSLTSTTITGTVAVTQSGTWTVTGAGGTFPVTDSGGSLTVDAPVGTPVFVRLSDGTSAIATLPVSLTSTTVTGTVAVTQSGTWNITNVSGTISLPTGASTAANQTSVQTPITPATATATVGMLLGMQYNSTQATFTNGQQGSIQGTARGAIYVATGADAFNVTLTSTTITGTVAVTQSGTWNIGTVTTLTGITNALPAGTNNIGDVDVLTVPADPFGVNADAASATGSISAKLRFIASTGIPITGTVTVASHAVTNAGTFVVQENGAALTALQLIDNLVLAEDAAHVSGDPGIQVLSVRRDTAASSTVTDGDYATINTDSTGRLWCNVSNTVTVASHAVTNAGTFAVQVDGAALTSLQLLDDAVSGTGFNVSQLNGVNVTMGNGASGTGVQRVTLANDSTGIVSLTTSTASIGKLASNTGVTIGAVEIAAAQTLATVTTVGTVTLCSTVTTLTGGGVASDGVDSGNPIKTGAQAVATMSTRTIVAAADRVDSVADVDGASITRPNTTLADLVSGQATNTDGTSTQCIAAQSSGIKTYLTDITLANSSASNITVDIKDGTTVKWTFPVPANGGVTHSWASPIAGTAATAWNFDPSAAASTVSCSMSGFKSKV